MDGRHRGKEENDIKKRESRECAAYTNTHTRRDTRQPSRCKADTKQAQGDDCFACVCMCVRRTGSKGAKEGGEEEERMEDERTGEEKGVESLCLG